MLHKNKHIWCPDCAGMTLFVIKGNGKCRACLGSGQDLNVNSEVFRCARCEGSGVCPACSGSGAVLAPPLARRWQFLWLPVVLLSLLLASLVAYRRSARSIYVPIAGASSDLFHRRLSNAQDDLIYDEADGTFR